MATFLIYILKWALSLTLLYSLYGLLLRRETFHALNRAVLLSVLVGSMVLPLCSFETEKTTPLQEGVLWMEERVKEVAMALPQTEQVAPHEAETEARPLRQLSLVRVLAWVYVAGLVVSWLMYLGAIFSALHMIRRGRPLPLVGRGQKWAGLEIPRGVVVLVNERAVTPFSWMCWVVLTSSKMDDFNRAILAHELEHIRCRHSWDMLLCDATTRMLWWLPFVWMLRHDLADVHEYQADLYVTTHGYGSDEYQLLLVKKAVNAGLQPVVNGFNRSSIKRRLKMMYQKKSNRAAMLKVFYLLPLVAFVATAFARPTLMKELQNTIREEEERAPLLALPKSEPEEAAMASPQTGQRAEDSNAIAGNAEDAEGDGQADVSDTLDLSLGVDTCFATPTPNPEALLDSTMTAVGARKIGQGVYVGAFRPNYTGDTIRVKHVQIDGGAHWEIDGREDGYTIWLQKEDREELGRGYHIRTMQPAQQAKTPHVNNAPIDPHWRPAEVTRHEADAQSMRLERGKDETRLNVYMTTEMPNPEDGTLDMLGVDFAELALIDPKTGDRYMCRLVENYEDKFVALSIGDKAGVVVKITAIYPPLPKKVRRVELAIHTPNGWERTGTVFKLKKDERPVQVIH